MFISIICPGCKHTWLIPGDIVLEDGIEVIKVGLYDDICPICGLQGDVDDLHEHEFALV